MKKLITLILFLNAVNSLYSAQAASSLAPDNQDEIKIVADANARAKYNHIRERWVSTKHDEKVERLSALFFELRLLNARNPNYQLTLDQINEKIEEIKSIILTGDIEVNATLRNTPATPLIVSLSMPIFNNFTLWLIDNGAWVNQTSSYSSPLQQAVGIFNLTMVKYLLKVGARSSPWDLKWVLSSALFSDNPENVNLHIQEEVLKIVLLNGEGARFRHWEGLQDSLKRNAAASERLKQALQEITNEYRKKIENYNIQVTEQFLTKANMPNVLIKMVRQYNGNDELPYLPNYTDEQIIDNIVDIRKALGELNENGIEVQWNIDELRSQLQQEAQIAQQALVVNHQQKDEIPDKQIEQIVKDSESSCVIS